MMDEKLEEISRALVPGVIALFVLLFLTGPEYFFTWVIDKITFYLILFFFFKVIASVVIHGKFERKEIIPLSLGIVLLIPYSFLTKLSFMDVIIMTFEVIIIVSFFWPIFSSLKEKVSGGY